MKTFEFEIYREGEYNYAAAYGFVPFIHAYVHEEDTDKDAPRPVMLLIPGGGYCMVCNIEGEGVAEVFYNKGMNVFVLTYTTDITMSVPLLDQPMKDASRAIRLLRRDCNKYHIDPQKLTICGFSAGGHLCACISNHFADITDNDPTLAAIDNRPDAAVLGYPVITAGEYTHIYSIQSLLGYTPTQDELDYYSLEKQVSETTPPTFVWQTVEDDLVPIENSIMYATALQQNHIPYAFYAFPHGPHGLSVATDRIRQGNFGEPYTMRQCDLAIENIKNNTAVNVSQQRHDELMIQFFGCLNPDEKKDNSDGQDESQTFPNNLPPFTPPNYPDVNMWPELADAWLKSQGML